MTRLRTLLAAALGCLLITGCVTVPTTGPVQRVPVTQGPGGNSGVDIAAVPPAENASPDLLIAGFLQSMAAYQSDYQVARLYLTEDAAQSWQPEEGVRVYDGTPPTTTAETATLDAHVVGQVSSSGQYLAVSERLVHDFKLVKVDSQWRISNPPDGLLVSQFLFSRYYRPYPIYFLNPNLTTVVPDLVWLPDAAASPAAVLEALFAGPSPAIAPAVETAVPAGTRLAQRDLTISSEGVADINLVGAIASLNDNQRRLLGAQLSWTMTSFARVKALNVTDDGKPFEIPGQSRLGWLDLASQQGFQVLSGQQTADLFGVREGALGRVGDDGAFEPVGGPLGQPGAAVGAVGISLDGNAVAVTDTLGASLRVGATDGAVAAVPLPGFTQLTDPQIVLGTAWVAGRAPNGSTQLIGYDTAGGVTTLTLPADVARTQLRAFAVAPGGSRVALVVDRGGGTEIGIALMNRGARTLTNWQPIDAQYSGSRLSDFRDIDWADETTLMVLADSPASILGVYSMSFDGAGVTWVGPGGQLEIASLSTLPRMVGSSLAVSVAGGRALRYDARAQWREVKGAFDLVVFAG